MANVLLVPKGPSVLLVKSGTHDCELGFGPFAFAMVLNDVGKYRGFRTFSFSLRSWDYTSPGGLGYVNKCERRLRDRLYGCQLVVFIHVRYNNSQPTVYPTPLELN